MPFAHLAPTIHPPRRSSLQVRSDAGRAFVKFTDAINVTTGSSGSRSLAYRPFVGLTVTNFGGSYGRYYIPSPNPDPAPSGPLSSSHRALTCGAVLYERLPLLLTAC